jgi:hypothetical protein
MPTLARVGRWAQDLICLSVYMCSWVCVKPRLALPALRGFRLELAGEQNPIRFPYHRWDRDGHTIMDHVAASEDLMIATAAY